MSRRVLDYNPSIYPGSIYQIHPTSDILIETMCLKMSYANDTYSLHMKYVCMQNGYISSLLFVLNLQVVGILRATDKDDQPAKFRFSLASESANFSIRDHGSKSLCALSIHLPFCSKVALNSGWRKHCPQHLLLCNN